VVCPLLRTDSEQLDRNRHKPQRLLKAARLKIDANPKDIDYQHPRDLRQAMMAKLLQLEWINKKPKPAHHRPLRQRQNLYRLCAGACRLHERLPGEIQSFIAAMLEPTQSKADHSYSKALQALSKLECLIVDDGDWSHLTPPSAIDANHG